MMTMHYATVLWAIIAVCYLSALSASDSATVEQRLAALEEQTERLERQLNDVQLKGGYDPIGTILPYAGEITEEIPDGWLLCDGRKLLRDDYPDLHRVIGLTFTKLSMNEGEFQIPDFRGRTLVGAGQGSTGGALTQRSLGSYLGTENHTLSVNEMPSHSHSINDKGHAHTYNDEQSTFTADPASVGQSGTTYNKGSNNRQTSSVTTGILIQSTGSSLPHENMQPSAIVNFIIKARPPITTATTTTTMTMPRVTPWPKPEKLAGFWPLNSIYELRDVSQNGLHAVAVSPYATTTSGPFGQANAAFRAVEANSSILQVPSLAITSSFTISLFFQHQPAGGPVQQGGILEFIDSKYGTSNALQFRYDNDDTIEVSANSFSIGHYKMIQQKGVWTFVAFVFDSSTSMFTVYGKHGVVSPATLQSHIWSSNTFNNNGMRLGYASRWSQGLQTTDAVSCLMVYLTALNDVEIRQIHDACRIIHGSAPCGAPKLALPAIPASTSITTIAKPGQFPFVASLRVGGAHICSASIVDDYWLLTSAWCFRESKNVSAYSIYVGEQDLDVDESYTKKHTCSKIIFSSSSDSIRDVALVQVTEPIDFTSDYANDVCLYRSDNADNVRFDATQFVFGWGKNGRQPMISQTLGRYVPGLTMTDSQCLQAWGAGNYSIAQDFCFMSASTDKNVPCSGDEGTPLLLQASAEPAIGISERLFQVGVYYKRDANCSPTAPGLFTNVAQYSTWIAEQIACAVPGVVYPDKCPQK